MSAPKTDPTTLQLRPDERRQSWPDAQAAKLARCCPSCGADPELRDECWCTQCGAHGDECAPLDPDPDCEHVDVVEGTCVDCREVVYAVNVLTVLD